MKREEEKVRELRRKWSQGDRERVKDYSDKGNRRQGRKHAKVERVCQDKEPERERERNRQAREREWKTDLETESKRQRQGRSERERRVESGSAKGAHWSVCGRFPEVAEGVIWKKVLLGLPLANSRTD